MTLKEVIALMGILYEAYPRFYPDKSKVAIMATAKLWTGFLEDVSAETAVLALQRLIATCKFPPTIAEMRESLSLVKDEPVPDSGEAWGEVNAAIREYGFYRPEEAFASMREPVRMAAQRMGWRELCMSENDMADRAHFLRIYENIKTRMETDRQLPERLKTLINANIKGIGDSSLNDTAIPFLTLQQRQEA